MYQLFHQTTTKLMRLEPSPHRLALSGCVGIFLACAPFLGIQTILAIGMAYLFALNSSIVLATLFLVNNPLTMVPIIIADQMTGKIILEHFLSINTAHLLPSWTHTISSTMNNKIQLLLPQTHFSIANYIFGGLLFGLICCIPSYPLLYWISKKYNSTAAGTTDKDQPNR